MADWKCVADHETYQIFFSLEFRCYFVAQSCKMGLITEFVIARVVRTAHVFVASSERLSEIDAIRSGTEHSFALVCDDFLCLLFAQTHCKLLTLAKWVLNSGYKKQKRRTRSVCAWDVWSTFGWLNLLTLHDVLSLFFWISCINGAGCTNLLTRTWTSV